MTRAHRKGRWSYKYGYKYGIAFPNSFRSLSIRKLPFDVMDKFNTFVFFVDRNGDVEIIDWKIMKNIVS